MSLRTIKIISILSTIVVTIIFLQGATFRLPGNQQDYAPIQPINFSHKVHAGDNKIACLYCHSAAEKSSVAGIPATSVCMNCHTQVRKDFPEVQKVANAYAQNQPIQWVRIHSLPNHVAFNHSRHVTAGVQCQTCHGPIETMERVAQATPLTMGMCISCHRTHRGVVLDAAGKPVLSKDPKQTPLQASTDCSVCHH